jgi:signal transduction histidine kinase
MSAAIRILHLEDDAGDARLIREQLRHAGLDAAITVVSGRDAFEGALANSAFDLVLSDFRVPRFNGLEALESLRRASQSIPFILVTGALGEEGAIEILRSGATDCVLKDRLVRLGPVVQRALAEYDVHRQHVAVQTQLAEANRLSKLAAEAARLGTWQLHVASGKLEVSEEFLNLIRVRRFDWAGTVSALEAVMHPEDVERRRRLDIDAVREGRFMEMEFRIQMPDGEMRWMYLRGDCSLGADGTPSLYVGVMMDITERKTLEEALKEADRRKDEFLATLAHELRNPLATVHSGLSILRQPALSSAEQSNVHAMLERQTGHIIRLVDDLMDISRYTRGKIQLKRVPTELQAVLHNAVEMSQSLIRAGHHNLNVSTPAHPIMLNADGVRLAQVMSNLLNNAAKYTAKGGQIWLDAQVRENQVVLSVRDNGVGIPADMLDRIFGLFTQLDRNKDGGSASGLGIGLALVRILVELHGGKVEARSGGLGQGSEFIVRLPVLHAELAAAPNANVAGSTVSLAGRKILVVDDNHDAADSLCLLLKLTGAEVEATYDGPGALAAIPVYRPHIVLLDLGMPGMDGYTIASRIRHDPRNRGLILIALTGFGQDEDRKRAASAGFNDHLTKPADLNVLQSVISSFKVVEEHSSTCQEL